MKNESKMPEGLKKLLSFEYPTHIKDLELMDKIPEAAELMIQMAAALEKMHEEQVNAAGVYAKHIHEPEVLKKWREWK